MKRTIQVTFTIDDGDDAGKTEADWREQESTKVMYTPWEQSLIRASVDLFHAYKPRSFKCEYTVRDGNGVFIVAGVVIKREDNPVLQMQSEREEGIRDHPFTLDGSGPDVDAVSGDEAETREPPR